MRHRATASAATVEPIDPLKLYPNASIPAVTGLSVTRMSEARRDGVVLETIEVGRRKFASGKAVIRYVHELAELEKSKRLRSNELAAYAD